MNNNLIIQALAVIAFAGFTASFYFPKRNQILFGQVIFLLIWSLHFILIHAPTGAIMLFLGAVRSGVFYFKPKYKILDSKIVLYCFFLILTVASLLTWQGWYSILPLIAVIFVSIAHWQIDVNKLRLICIPSTFFWFFYDLIVKSYGSMISEVIMLILIIVSLLVYSKKKSVFKFI